MYTDAIDSYYQYVKGRIKSLNSTRIVAGLLNAQDWPNTKAKLEAFYLLVLKDASAPRGTYSAESPIIAQYVQWVWTIRGNEIPDGMRAANRGDRFRTDQAMRGELLSANTPYCTEKKTWKLVNGLWVGSSLDPVEYFTWSMPQFGPTLDKSSGLVYGAASVCITNMTDHIST